MNLQNIRNEQKLDAIILFAPEEILAATDIFIQNGCLLADDRGLTVICPEGGVQEVPGIQWIEYAEYGFRQVADAWKNLWDIVRETLKHKKFIGYVKYTAPAALMDAFSGQRLLDISEVIRSAALCKSDAFFRKYATVRQMNIRAYDRIKEKIRAGHSELELWDAVKASYVCGSHGQVLYTGDFLSGRRTCEISGPATNKIIRKGDAVIADALCACDGIYCDTTRSYFCGMPDDTYMKAYEALVRILDEAAPLLRPRAAASDIYSFINQRLGDAGYGPLPHHAGHGLGYRWYEAPYFIEDCTMPLQEDMFVTLEPGIYIPEQFGLRLENNYRVTKDGGIDIFNYKQSIEDFIIE